LRSMAAPYGRAMREGATPAGSYIPVCQPVSARPLRLTAGDWFNPDIGALP